MITAVPYYDVSRSDNTIHPENLATYHSWSANFHDFSSGCSQRSLSTNHAGAIRYHCNANERKAVIVPCNTRRFSVKCHVLFLRGFRALIVDRNVDVANIEVKGGDYFHAGNLGEFGKNLWGIPGIENKWSSPA